MELHSGSFVEGERIPDVFTCEGKDRSPSLSWFGVPATARSFVLIADDPDAPMGTWFHWGVYNIPAAVTALEEGFASGVNVGGIRQAVNDFGRHGYGGPCPPPGHGVHHYHFRLLALEVEHLDLPDNAHCRDVEKAAQPHVVGRAEFVGTYSR